MILVYHGWYIRYSIVLRLLEVPCTLRIHPVGAVGVNACIRAGSSTSHRRVTKSSYWSIHKGEAFVGFCPSDYSEFIPRSSCTVKKIMPTIGVNKSITICTFGRTKSPLSPPGDSISRWQRAGLNQVYTDKLARLTKIALNRWVMGSVGYACIADIAKRCENRDDNYNY